MTTQRGGGDESKEFVWDHWDQIPQGALKDEFGEFFGLDPLKARYPLPDISPIAYTDANPQWPAANYNNPYQMSDAEVIASAAEQRRMNDYTAQVGLTTPTLPNGEITWNESGYYVTQPEEHLDVAGLVERLLRQVAQLPEDNEIPDIMREAADALERLQSSDRFWCKAWEDKRNANKKYKSEIERLQQENEALAADQCHHGYAGEHGHHCCKYQDTIARLRAALEFYANPETYFGIGFFPDSPSGEFIEDFEELTGGLGHPDGGEWVKPGKRARAALSEE